MNAAFVDKVLFSVDFLYEFEMFLIHHQRYFDGCELIDEVPAELSCHRSQTLFQDC